MLSLTIHRVSESKYDLIGTHETAGDFRAKDGPFSLADARALLEDFNAKLAAGVPIAPFCEIQGCCRCGGSGYGTFPNSTTGALRSGRCFRCNGLGARGVIARVTAQREAELLASSEALSH